MADQPEDKFREALDTLKTIADPDDHDEDDPTKELEKAQDSLWSAKDSLNRARRSIR
jgi:hypothetical protein